VAAAAAAAAAAVAGHPAMIKSEMGTPRAPEDIKTEDRHVSDSKQFKSDLNHILYIFLSFLFLCVNCLARVSQTTNRNLQVRLSCLMMITHLTITKRNKIIVCIFIFNLNFD
jgi:hypothetical protein